MQTPVEIDFRGLEAAPRIRDAISEQVAELEERYSRLTACRIVVKGPGPHHRNGGPFEVHIRLSLPEGREVNVSRNAGTDERHADLTFAIEDAFKHARRRLEDRVRRLQGHVKTRQMNRSEP
jgi:ribosome-associated translation inhibitor RaiA